MDDPYARVVPYSGRLSYNRWAVEWKADDGTWHSEAFDFRWRARRRARMLNNWYRKDQLRKTRAAAKP